jgi:phosphoribosylaminoimidazole carboxylase (NCAIR synthetase)
LSAGILNIMPEDLRVIAAPATIGILGGGQLGAMLCEAGRRMGYRMAVLSESADDPAGRWADEHVIGEFCAAAGRVDERV